MKRVLSVWTLLLALVFSILLLSLITMRTAAIMQRQTRPVMACALGEEWTGQFTFYYWKGDLYPDNQLVHTLPPAKVLEWEGAWEQGPQAQFDEYLYSGGGRLYGIIYFTHTYATVWLVRKNNQLYALPFNKKTVDLNWGVEPCGVFIVANYSADSLFEPYLEEKP